MTSLNTPVKNITIRDFDTINVSTKTYTANTNLIIDIYKLYDVISVVPYIVHPKKRGRKKKGAQSNLNENIPYGSIVTAKCEDKIKGIELKPKSLKKVKTSYFRNSITLVMILDKPINFKVCRNGTFQMTGCKKWEHAEMCVKKIWEIVKDRPEIFTYNRNEGSMEALIIPSMRNIDFDIGFFVDREKLSRYMNSNADLYCMMETSFGYTGVNIKIPLSKDRNIMQIKKFVYSENDWVCTWSTYDEYLSILTEKARVTKMKETRYNTFLVFHSGKVIFSGLSYEYMRDTYYMFMNIINDAFDSIEERLEGSYPIETNRKAN